jgi:hypothetical protein
MTLRIDSCFRSTLSCSLQRERCGATANMHLPHTAAQRITSGRHPAPLRSTAPFRQLRSPLRPAQYEHGRQQRQQQRCRQHADATDSPVGSRSFDSHDFAEEMLGSSGQRKGAAHISADALTSLSQDDAGPVAGSCCSAHRNDGHEHTPKIENRMHRVLLWIYSHTGARPVIRRMSMIHESCRVELKNIAHQGCFLHAQACWLQRCEVSCSMARAGLFQLANVLRGNTLGSIAISVLFAVAALTHWQAGQHLPAVLAQRISEAATAAVYFIAGGSGTCWASIHRCCSSSHGLAFHVDHQHWS